MSNAIRKLIRRWYKIPVSYRGGIILAIPALCTIAILILWSELRQKAIVVNREINRSQLTIVHTNNLLQLLTSAETGVRGYVITNQADFLEPYQQAVVNSPNYLESLKDLQHNTNRSEDVRTIELLVEQELDLLAQTIDSDQSQTNSSAAKDLLIQSQKKISQVRVTANAFKSESRKILARQRQELFNVTERTNVAFFLAAVVSFLSFLAALYLFELLEQELNRKQRNLRARAGELALLNQALATTNNTLAERNLELDRFSHIVSHDLKAPLRGISNLAEWIEEDLDDKLTEDIKQHLQLQRERVARMENLIDGLLQYARVGKENAEVEIVDVRQLLETIIDSLDPPPNFAIAIGSGMPVITTHKLLLERVFSNLISNAIKHHPRLDGKVVIAVVEKERGYEFSVSDDGAGIAPMAQTRIFDMFQTLNPQDKSNTGVGLAIVKKIVEEGGGKITVESEVGRTTFTFQWH